MEQNEVKLTVTLSFTEDAKVTKKDREVIIDNLLTAITNQINSGMGIAPDDPENGDYITETVTIKDETGSGIMFDLKDNQYI